MNFTDNYDDLYIRIESCNWKEVYDLVEEATSQQLFYIGAEAGDTLLHLACSIKGCPLPIIKKLLNKGLDPNTSQRDGATPLHIAVNVSPELVKILLDGGADPNKPEEDGHSPVYVATENNSNPELVKLLLDRGGDPDQPDFDGFNPVYVGAQKNVTPELMELLLERGGDPNKPGHNQWTPLHIAAFNGASIELVQLMLDFGANPKLTKPGGSNVLNDVENPSVELLLRNPPPQSRWPRRTTKKSYPGNQVAPEKKMRISESNHPTVPRHLMFFSYAQQDCAAETFSLAQRATDMFQGASIFRDADIKFKLDELVEHVKYSKNVIVLLSENYPRRPFTLIELHTALKSGANVVPVKVARPGLGQFDFKQVSDDIRNGQISSYLDEVGWALLKKHGMDARAVKRDLETVMNVKACELNLNLVSRVSNAMVEARLHHVSSTKRRTSRSHSVFVVTVALVFHRQKIYLPHQQQQRQQQQQQHDND